MRQKKKMLVDRKCKRSLNLSVSQLLFLRKSTLEQKIIGDFASRVGRLAGHNCPRSDISNAILLISKSFLSITAISISRIDV